MAKKGDAPSKKKTDTVVKKAPVKKVARSKPAASVTKEGRVLEKLLIENFISMQKVMSKLVVSFDGLSRKIEDLLTLFEDSAKAVAEKEINLELQGDRSGQKEILDKLKLLLDQNKLIARGITIMHEHPRGSSDSDRSVQPQSAAPSLSSPRLESSMQQGFKAAPLKEDEAHEIVNPTGETKPKAMEAGPQVPSPSASM